MELRVLRYFLAVAQEENITRAAQRLHLTQPTLSRQMMLLEQELGVTLFDRGRRNVALTEEGQLLRVRAQALLALSDKTVRDLAGLENSLEGEIALGCREGRNMQALARAAAIFQRRYPQVRFRLCSLAPGDLRAGLGCGLIDLGVWTEPVDRGEWESLPLPQKERWGALVEQASPLASMTAVTPEALSQVPLILPQEETAQQALSDWAAAQSVQLAPAASYQEAAWAAALVRAGGGAALCPEPAYCGDDLKFLPLAPPLERQAFLVWKKNRMYARAAGQFLAWCRHNFSLS